MNQTSQEFRMNGFHQIWWKLLAAFLLVAAVSLGAVIIIIRQISESTYNTHLQHMSEQGGNMMMMAGNGPMNLNQAFSDAINGSLIWGSTVAVSLALVLSLLISRRITRPIHDMAAATERIAEGDYAQRVTITSKDEIGSLAHSLNSMASRLAESQRLRRELMANIAHELRTPLTSISGYMEGLEDGVVPATTETFDLVRREALRLSRLVEDLQRLTRAESGQESLDLVRIEPRPFLERISRKMMPQFSERGVELEIVASQEVSPLLADEDKLDQILVNLLDNALRYTETGGRVTISASAREGKTAIEVADTGSGIDAEDIPHIFERFYRADKSRARVSGGTGIGLTIVKRYVESLNGKIEVESQPGRGTRFTVELPLAG